MKVLVYGGGAVGLGIASCLIKSGASVGIISRQETVKSLLQDGLIRKGLFGHHVASPSQFQAYTCVDSLAHEGYDCVLIVSKAYAVEKLCRELFSSQLPHLMETKIVVFNNGWGSQDIVSRFTRPDNIYHARVITGFIKKKLNEVDITVHADAIHIGSLYNTDNPPVISRLIQLIDQGGIPCRVSPDIEADLWAKMLYNCSLNSLGALLNVKYGVLGETVWTKMILEQIIREVFRVMLVLGYRTHWLSAEEYLSVFYSSLLPATYNHVSSMLQDIRAGKRTEIDFLNGVIVEGAQNSHQTACYNRLIRDLIKAKEIIKNTKRQEGTHLRKT